MKIDENIKLKPLHDIVAFKWLKPDDIEKLHSGIYIPHDLSESKGDRLGRLYMGQVIALGPECYDIQVGDKFLIHEYDLIDQSEKWDASNILCCKQDVITCVFDKSTKALSIDREITPDLEKAYMENDESVQASVEETPDTFDAREINPSIRHKYGI